MGTVTQAWTALNVDPKALATLAKSKSERLKIANQRVDEYFDKLLKQQAQFVEITEPVQTVLRDKYDWTINPEALDQVLLQAAKVRLATDSTAKAAQPSSVVPVPNTPDTTKK
jgi:hypothetical protein